MNLDQGKSMAPLILPSDKVIVKKGQLFEVNDIIAFLKGNRLITHRLIYIDPSKNFYITKGDNNNKHDGKIKFQQILGKVKGVKRDGEIINLSHIYLSQSSNYLKELAKVNKSLVKNKVPYLILKGLPIHLVINRTPPKRLYCDVDILIQKSHLAKVDKILARLGFKRVENILFGKKIKSYTQISYIKVAPPYPVVIDLHLEPAIGFIKYQAPNRLLPKRVAFTKHLLNNVSLIKINNNTFPVLSHETLIIYLFLHLFHHNFQGAHRLEFIDSLARTQKMNWDEVKNIVVNHKLQNFIFPGVIILKHYYKTPFPKKLLKEIRPPVTQRFLSHAIKKLISPFNKRSRALEGTQRLILILLLSPSPIQEKIKVIFEKETGAYFLLTIKSFFSRSFTNSP